ncbi:helix-turn-helix domain-containing protein [Sinomicrobium oceani]|uniref:helix-turn-helix domain-containing protein n=1 Tax=Sinomicrobium oceani TaxID=1150368 RepID=UPI00227AC1AC|nr:AraC family transcriptional regulator [Sinomicrobium oceani]
MSKSIFKYSFSLLNTDYVKLNSSWNYANVISPYYRIYYIDDGIAQLSGKETVLTLKPGYLYLIPSFTICNMKCDSYLSQYFLQFFEETPNGISLFQDQREIMQIKAMETDILNFKRILKINPGRGINRSDNPKVYEKQAYYDEYISLNHKTNLSLQFENQGIILQLLSRFLKSGNIVKKQTDIPSKILDSMSYIQLHLDRNITITELAKRANQNKDYFSRLFLTHTGKRPMTYILEKKIERAQHLMLTTNKTLLEISIETGFSNVPHFTNTFKKIVSITPAAYRRQNENMA